MVEIATNIGGIDLMTEHRDVIVELKLDQEADIPLTQTEKTRDQEQFFHPKKKDTSHSNQFQFKVSEYQRLERSLTIQDPKKSKIFLLKTTTHFSKISFILLSYF